jgi:CRISPR-associated protein Csb2
VGYRRASDPPPRPCVVFKLLDEDDDTVSYPHAKLIHVAGMVRHLAIKLMAGDPPRDLRGRSVEEWVEQYVAGHAAATKDAAAPHGQFSYVPLPSIGMAHTDPAIRRVMIVAPYGDEAWLQHLARRLDGRLLEPEKDVKLPPGARLVRIPENRRDGVRTCYTQASRVWSSFTPIILPGHDDRKPAKTCKLIEKALAQSGVDNPCEFTWSPFSRFPKAYSAHKYVRTEKKEGEKKAPAGYIRPNHLLNQTAVHLTLRFESEVPGPLLIGAGRHCGFGLMAADSE